MKPASTSAEWRAEFAGLERRRDQQAAVVTDCEAIVARNALARARGERTAVAASAEAESAKARAAAERAALHTAIEQANLKLGEAIAAESAAAARALEDDYRRRGAELMTVDRGLVAAAAQIDALLTKRKTIAHGLLRHPCQNRSKAGLYGLTDLEIMLGAALAAEPEFGSSLRLLPDKRAAYKFVARDCNIFDIDMPRDVANPPLSAVERELMHHPKNFGGGAAPGPAARTRPDPATGIGVRDFGAT